MAWHALPLDEVARRLETSLEGLEPRAAAERLERVGPNRLESAPPAPRWRIFLRQFQSPLIYVLLAAAALSVALGEVSDAGFIAAVLLLNAAIGYANESRAQQEVQALSRLVQTRARVHRGKRTRDVDAEQVVPGDRVLLESGARVPADLRLVEAQGLRVDESLLTGESVPVEKDAGAAVGEETPLAERRNMVFSGCLVVSGRGAGLAVATGAASEVGSIAGELARVVREPPPLIQRMERFARRLGGAALVLSAAIVAIGLARGQSLVELLFASVALAVSAIPEGLPVALTVALAVAVSRMAGRRVVVRHLPAVEALGSCGVIATDKTGTLTRNELTVERLRAGTRTYTVTGVGYAPEGHVTLDGRAAVLAEHPSLFRLLRAGVLANEAELRPGDGGGDGGEWEATGDPTDVALLSAAIKAGLDPEEVAGAHETRGTIPFEAELRYAASFHDGGGRGLVCAKGAPERVLGMCRSELTEDGAVAPLDAERARQAVEDLMREGYRVIAVADREGGEPLARGARPPEPEDLVFLGLVAMTDPPREGVPEAIARCRRAGIQVAMVTGDHATTASAIAERIGLAEPGTPALTGDRIARLSDEELAAALADVAVIARATPADKLRAVRAWQSRGAFVAVTGDGVNDAPALRQANLGVAMGRGGTDVAREAADLVITDDNFATIVSGVEEGRVAYDNVRKVTYLLVSTGAGEVVTVLGVLVAGLGIPFHAAQLLWLNLVTNGIQGVALAFEPGEPDVLDRPVRPPGQGLFDRLMLERTALAVVVLGGVSLAAWIRWTAAGLSEAEARSLLVQLFVLFEIFHIGNARSEAISLFRLSPLRNRMLLLGTLGAMAVHAAALYTPFFQDLLRISPPSLAQWAELVLLALPIVVVMEAHKLWRGRRTLRRGAA